MVNGFNSIASGSKLTSSRPVKKSTSISISVPTNKLEKKHSRKGKERAVELPPPPPIGIKKASKKRSNKNKKVKKVTESSSPEVEKRLVRAKESSRSRSNSPVEELGDVSDTSSSASKRRKQGLVEGDEWGEMDWWDPRSLPKNGNGKVRTENQLKALEFGTYKVALHDVVRNELDLGRTLMRWEAVRKKRVEDELIEAEAVEEEEKEKEEGKSAKAEEEVGNQSIDLNDLNLNSNADEEEEEPTRSTSYPSSSSVDPVPTSLPFPSSLKLSQLTRWPIPLSQLRPSSSSLPDVISTLAIQNKRNYAKNHPITTPKSRKLRSKLRSAYQVSAPWGKGEKEVEEEERVKEEERKKKKKKRRAYDGIIDLSEESEEVTSNTLDTNNDSDTSSIFESDDAGNLSSSLDDDDPLDSSTLTGRTFITTKSILDQVLDKLAEKVPKSSWPPGDYWEAKMRLEAGDDIAKREKALGWEDLVEVVREMKNIPSSISDALIARMESFYGTSSRFSRASSATTTSTNSPQPSSSPPLIVEPSKKRVLIPDNDEDEQELQFPPAKKIKRPKIQRASSASSRRSQSLTTSFVIPSATSTPPPAPPFDLNRFSSPYIMEESPFSPPPPPPQARSSSQMYRIPSSSSSTSIMSLDRPHYLDPAL